ncbi:MAG: beta-lactamase family protein [Ruminococcus sp.]|nr:beta-lactamase family protein [Ruminococcus sp.]
MKNIFKRFTGIFCAGFLLTSIIIPSVHAEETDTALTLPSGLTIEKVQRELYDKVNTNFGEPVIASAVVGIFQGDDVLYTGYFGETDMENHISADENSVYEWGSISKTLIWVSAMQLWEQEKLDLNSDVREYLPDGFFQHLSYDNIPITMLNLMNHNAGWQETTKPIFKNDENAILSLGEELQLIEPAQVNTPGKISAYSNYGAALAGYVIECITGQDYCDYVHENIFEPLGMEHTALNPVHSDNAWVYEQRKKTKSYSFSLGNCISLGNKLDYIPAYPAGSATGTLSDLMTYAQALVNDDAPLFQNPETQEIMYTGTDFYGESDIPMCAHGFWCTEYAVRTYGHTGATTAGQANMLFDLDSKTGLVIIVNEPNGNFVLSDTPALVFGELPADKYNFIEPKKAELNGYYLSARSTHSGMLKLIPYLSAMPASNFAESEYIGRGVYQLRIKGQSEDDTETAVLFGEKVEPNNKLIALQMPSMDLIPCQLYLLKLSLLTVYILLAVVSVYLLLIRHKLKKHNRWTAYKGSAIIATGHIAKLVSVLAMLVMCVIYINNSGGVSVTAGAVFGIMQMLCIVICGVSAVTSCVSVMAYKKEKLLNIMNTIGCILSVLAIMYFEMYKFWI